MANKRKPKQEKNFFDKLKKTFSSDVIIRRTSRFGLKVLDPDGTQHYSTNMRDRYHRLFYSRTAQNSGGIARQVMLSIQNQRIAFFRDYEIMNRDPIIASALDIFSEEASLKDEMGRVLDIRSSSSEVKEVLENLFYDVLNIEFNLAPWIHAACMYGDFFLWLEIVKDYGIVGIRPLSVYDTIRHEGENPDNPKEVYFTTMGISGREETLDNYEVVHFRIESDTNFYPYGRSIIEPARRVFKQLYLVEDAMLIHRIMRAPQKRIFKIDVGNIPPKDIENEINKIVNETKKIPVQDERTGDYNLRYNMQSLIEDYYLPVRGKDHGTSIDTLTGLEYNGIEDVTYLLNKMFAALKVPKAFLTYDADSSGKTSVSCVVPETKIPLLDGTTKTVQELIDDYENGIVNYAYSIDEETHKIVPGKITWAGFTRKDAQLVRVTLDNGEYIDCTPDHKFMLRNGKWEEAKDLVPGESLMPLYKKKMVMRKNLDYEKVYHPGTDSWEWTHKAVYAGENGPVIQPIQTGSFDRSKLNVIHHVDFNRHNNCPDNLLLMKFFEHIKVHDENSRIAIEKARPKINETLRTPEKRAEQAERSKQMYIDHPEYRNNVRDVWLSYTPEQRSEINRLGHSTDEYREKASANAKKNWDNQKDAMWEGYCKKYPDGIRYEMLGKNHFRWRERPTLQDIISFMNSVENRTTINKLSLFAKKFGISQYIIREVLNDAGWDVTEFFNFHFGFVPGRKKTMPSNVNHRVISIEFLFEKRDTCDITIEKYHNFATDAGVIIHNSQDIKFARTVEKIQRAITSELIKIAVIHLKAQGFEGENLCNFELSLTPPSTIYENEKITLWRERIALASDAKSSNLFSDKWIYETIVGFSRDEYERERELMVDDKKRTFRYSQIEQGNPDPSHMDPMSQQQMPNQFDPSQGLGMPGRPESGMVYGQDSHPRGRDPLSAQSKQFKMGKQTLEQKKLLPPSSEKGTYMSEEIIIEEHEIEFLDY